MKRLMTLLPAMFLMLMSCQQNLMPEMTTDMPDGEIMTKALSAGKVTPDDPVVFLPATDMKSWTDIGPLEDRFAACEVPQSRLSSMTTEALVKSMLNYPLNYLVFAYNDPQDAIDLIVEYSPLHKEFLSRTDGAEVFVDYYAAAGLDMRLEKSSHDGDYTSLSYTNTMFMDHFLGSKHMTGLGKASVKQKLAEAVSKKLQERLEDKNLSLFSVKPLLTIDETASLGIANLETKASVISTVTVYTPLGQSITGYKMSATSSTEAAQMENEAKSEYSSAIVKGPATWSYNCHSYAWHNSSTSNDVWINSDGSGSPGQVKKYWTNDLYEQCYNFGPNVEKVFYWGGDHSAIMLANGNAQSKWGAWPLMEHALTYSPYLSTDLRYYKTRYPEYLSFNISGPTSVTMNQNCSYSVSAPSDDEVELEWEVRFMDAPSPTPFDLYVSPNGRSGSLICEDYGLFKIIVTGYRNDIFIGSGQLEVIAMP